MFSVHTTSSEEVDKAKDSLERTGAKDISSTGEVNAKREGDWNTTSSREHDTTYF